MRAILLAVCLAACTGQTAEPPQAGGEHAPAATPRDLSAFFDCVRERGATIVAAHRGGPAPGYAENAIATFERAIEAGPVMLEIDVATTRDGQLVLMHDDTVDRTTTGRGRVDALTLAQVQQLRLRDQRGQVIAGAPPTLREALDWGAGRAVFELDVKRGTAFADVVEAVRGAGAEERVLIITYNLDDAIEVHRLDPRLMISVGIESQADVRTLEAAGIDLSRVLAWTGTREPDAALNVALRQRGIEVLFGTLGGADSWDRRFAREGDIGYAAFAETGVDLIATDRPLEAFAAIDAADGVEGWAGAACLR